MYVFLIVEGLLLTKGSENTSLFHFVSAMFACKLTYSLAFPIDSIPWGEEPGLLSKNCPQFVQLSPQGVHKYQKTNRTTEFALPGEIPCIPIVLYNVIVKFRASVSLTTSYQECWWDPYSSFSSHPVLASLPLKSRNDTATKQIFQQEHCSQH